MQPHTAADDVQNMADKTEAQQHHPATDDEVQKMVDNTESEKPHTAAEDEVQNMADNTESGEPHTAAEDEVQKMAEHTEPQQPHVAAEGAVQNMASNAESHSQGSTSYGIPTDLVLMDAEGVPNTEPQQPHVAAEGAVQNMASNAESHSQGSTSYGVPTDLVLMDAEGVPTSLNKPTSNEPSAKPTTGKGKCGDVETPTEDADKKKRRARPPVVDTAGERPTPSKKRRVLSESSSAPPPPPEREEFSNFIITKRTVPAEVWSQEILGKDRQVVPLARLRSQLAEMQDRDRVVIAVLYDSSSQEEMNNGEPFARLRLTDIAHPKARVVDLQVRRRAYFEWRGSKAAATTRRGAILALMNPLLEHGKSADGTIVVRIERQGAILKLGECPSLGRCEIQNCRKPCNADRKERFCADHIIRAYADKKGRIVAGGGHTAGVMALLKSERKFCSLPPPPEEELDPSEMAARENEARTAVTKAAAQLDDRRFSHSAAKEDYVKSVVYNCKDGSYEGSRVPRLGRGLAEDDGLTIDFDLIPSEENKKVDRIFGLRADRSLKALRAAAAADACRKREDSENDGQVSSVVAAAMKRSRMEKEKKDAAAATERSTSGARKLAKQPPKIADFADLVEALDVRRMPRRAGISRDVGPAQKSAGSTSGKAR